MAANLLTIMGVAMQTTTNVEGMDTLLKVLAGMGIFVLAVAVLVYLLTCFGLMRMFTKAGRPGWAAFVPILNIHHVIQMVRRPRWFIYVFAGTAALVAILVAALSLQVSGMLILTLAIFALGLACLVLSLILSIDLARAFGKGAEWGIGLFLLTPIFTLLLGLGSAQYVGAGGQADDAEARLAAEMAAMQAQQMPDTEAPMFSPGPYMQQDYPQGQYPPAAPDSTIFSGPIGDYSGTPGDAQQPPSTAPSYDPDQTAVIPLTAMTAAALDYSGDNAGYPPTQAPYPQQAAQMAPQVDEGGIPIFPRLPDGALPAYALMPSLTPPPPLGSRVPA